MVVVISTALNDQCKHKGTCRRSLYLHYLAQGVLCASGSTPTACGLSVRHFARAATWLSEWMALCLTREYQAEKLETLHIMRTGR